MSAKRPPKQPISTAPPPGTSVDRDYEKKMVNDALLKALNNEHSQAVFIEFYGLAGIGKTCLLDDNRAQAGELGIVSARLDGDDLSRAGNGLNHPGNGAAYVRLTDLIVNQLQGRPGEPNPHAYRDIAQRTLQEIGRAEPPDKQVLQPLASACRAYLENWLEQHAILLLLDCTDCFPKALLQWLNQEVLDGLTGQHKLVVIFAGRTPLLPDYLTPTILPVLVSHPVKPFNLQSTSAQLGAFPAGQPYQNKASLLHDLTQGHPKSNIAVVDYLQQKSTKVVSPETVELARYLQAEVIQKYIFDSIDKSRMRSIILLLAYPRRFESSLLADLLREYNPGLRQNLDPTSPPEIIKLISELIETPLVSYDSKEGGYKVEPLLAKLIQTCDLYTDPKRFANIHIFLSKWLLELPPDPQPENDVRSIGDGFYHFIQYLRSGIKSDPERDVAWAQDQLRQRLQEELERRYGLPNPKAPGQLNELRDWFGKDSELEIVFPGMQNILQSSLTTFIVTHPPALPAMLHIMLNTTNLDVSLSIPNQAIVLRQNSGGLNAAGRPTLQTVKLDLDNASPSTCRLMFRLCIPLNIQPYLQNLAVNAPLQIITNYANQPWELMHDGNDFLGLRLALGRLPTLSRLPKQNKHQSGAQPRFLLIGDPNGDLPGARREVETIKKQLDGLAQVKVLIGEEVTLTAFFNCLLEDPPFDVIHFAGHAAFDAERPGESDLKLSDGVVPARDIESTLSYRPLIFLNACEAGYQQSEDLPGSYMGSEIEGLAASCLLGGARGCIGPLWRVPDGQAADFAIAFYKHALDGDSLGTALRLARLESRKDAPITKVWAAYVLYGDPTVQLL